MIKRAHQRSNSDKNVQHIDQDQSSSTIISYDQKRTKERKEVKRGQQLTKVVKIGIKDQKGQESPCNG